MPATILLTPKELASAIGASESSLRRWVDSGRITMSRTAGGHRRIPLASAIQFIREIGATVVRPELLGLEVNRVAEGPVPAAPREEVLFDVLRNGDDRAARGLIVSWYLAGEPLHALFDGPIRGAMARLGELWNHDRQGILIEHRATEICIHAVNEITALLPRPAERARVALGGAPQGDPYVLPTLMASSVLREAGFRTINFGPNTPIELLAAEAVQQHARLVWVAMSATTAKLTLATHLTNLAASLSKRGIALVIGGRRHGDFVPRPAGNVTSANSMGELVAFARGMDRGSKLAGKV